MAAAADIEGNLARGTKVAVLNFNSDSERFSDYVIEEIAGALVSGKKLVVVDRQSIELIQKEMNLQLSGEVSDESAQRIGAMLGAQSIVSGSLVDTGAWFRFRVNTINVETAQRQVFTSKNINGSDAQVVFLLTGQRVGQTAPVTPAPAAQRPVTPTPAPEGFVRIQGGSFIMGSPASEVYRLDHEVQHRVTVSGFYMGKHEVTVGEFRQFVNATGYKTTAETSGGGYIWIGSVWETKADANWKNPYFSQQDNQPVVVVSWNDAVRYCNWRSEQEWLTPAYTINGDTVNWNRSANGYRLPTEAEWEYACRAGTTTAYSSGSSVDSAGWYGNNSGGTIHPVGTKQANGWGLYDMHGNVHEWCWDWYGAYGTAAQTTDPMGASSGSRRVYRGGSWADVYPLLRSAYRLNLPPSFRYNNLGFRILRPSL
jgi:formylglycine-generating enzyme required for sulfatase activity